ncbi:hypothetical protein [Nocardioides massiliensis]|uniref:Uncharacterized protein n=1 Tax=Nocardioides massiliensis TaxID=1325935 RepID=A0ABT9NJS0_9ACTN|nr:hypothetical protein [Nocardioides massiliensis]MDP9820644.1 hypothetical protein [Nocardioides massiliensis]
MKPYHIRFMAETGCAFALWGDPGRPLPLNGDEDAEDLENVLPISDDLRLRILDWANRYYRYDGGERDLDMWDFDGRGMHLSPDPPMNLGGERGVERECPCWAGESEFLRQRFTPRARASLR